MRKQRYRGFRPRTKIVCTIGPASSSPAVLERLARAGMAAARLNLAHGDLSEHSRHLRTIRSVASRLDRPIATILDLPGPKCRTRGVKVGRLELKPGSSFVLTTRPVDSADGMASVDQAYLPDIVRVDDVVLMDDGAIKVKVLQVSGTDISCRVLVGGVLRSGRSVSAPGRPIPPPYLTPQTKLHLSFAREERPDFIALSFITQPSNIDEVREALREEKVSIPLIAKIERPEAVRSFSQVLALSDGVMVARGDLGLEMPLERVPIVQKEVTRRCNLAGKPVIIATQMIESMVNSPRPTRAEVNDVANAIFDSADAIMLSAETSIGKYPVLALKTMSRIAREAESAMPWEELLLEKGRHLDSQPDDAIAYSACHMAHQLGAAAIVAFTESGSTARRVSRYRPRVPILGLTSSRPVQIRLSPCWGVEPLLVTEPTSLEEVFSMASGICRTLGVARQGEPIVVTAGVPLSMGGITNLLKLEIVK